eukprot:PhM_4_TR14102/c0_g2_i1/m.95365/K11426/SMYD; SET and MYND domain-containing protein
MEPPPQLQPLPRPAQQTCEPTENSTSAATAQPTKSPRNRASCPFDVIEVPGHGRGAVAASYLISGAVAYRGAPHIAVLYSDFVQQICATCFEPHEDLILCPNCQLFAVCPACAKGPLTRVVHPIECAWVCSLASSVREGETDYLRFVLRYCALRKLGDPAIKKINTLCTNTETQSDEFLDWCSSFAALFISHFHTDLGVITEDLIRLMCIVRANSLGFPFNSEVTLGWCLQTTVSMLNHSCTPNCAITAAGQEKNKMEVRTLRRVRAGEELTISYIDVHDPQNLSVDVRREAIFDRYRFSCDCELCSE